VENCEDCVRDMSASADFQFRNTCLRKIESLCWDSPAVNWRSGDKTFCVLIVLIPCAMVSSA
jgi:hypothetical protein